MIAEVLLLAAGIYLLGGMLFAIPFVWMGVGRLDPRAAHGSWGFRVLIAPGAMFLWPLLARRWVNGVQHPPDENNAHRRAARRDRDLQPAASRGCRRQTPPHGPGAPEGPTARQTELRRNRGSGPRATTECAALLAREEAQA